MRIIIAVIIIFSLFTLLQGTPDLRQQDINKVISKEKISRSFIDIMCRENKFPPIWGEDVRLAIADVCNNGNVKLEDISPSGYFRYHSGNYYFSAEVKAEPLVVLSSINVDLLISGMVFPMNGLGDGGWYKELEYGVLEHYCENAFEIGFRVTWQARSDRAPDYVFDRSHEIFSSKFLWGDGPIYFSPPGQYPDGIRLLMQNSGMSRETYYSGVQLYLHNFLGPGKTVKIFGYNLYCLGSDGIWKPFGPQDFWKIWDEDKITNPIELSCGESRGFNFGVKFTGSGDLAQQVGLVIINTDHGNFTTFVIAKPTPEG